MTSTSSRLANPAGHEAPLSPEELDAYRARDAELRLLRRADPRAGLAAAEGWLATTGAGTVEEAWATRACAAGQVDSGAHLEALASYELAARLFHRAGQPDEVARTGVGQVWTLQLLGRYDEAARLANSARRRLQAAGELFDAARITLNLGVVYRRLGRLEAARQSYLDAARVARRCGDLTLETTAVSNLGNILADLGRYDEAERAQRRAIRLYGALKQDLQLARAYLNLGILLKRRGDYGNAVSALRKSRAAYGRLENAPGLALANLDLTQTYLALNLQQEAEESGREALSGFARLDQPFELGQAHYWLAVLADRRGDRPEAARLLAEAVSLFRRIRNPLWESVARLESISIKEPSEAAVEAVARTERRLARLGARDRIIEARLVRADLLQRLGRNRLARAQYRAVAHAIRTPGEEHLGFRAHAALGRLLESTMARQALTEYQLAMEHLEALRRRARADDLKLAFVADKLDVYERSVGLLLRGRSSAHRAAAALAVVERGKSPGLLDDLLEAAERRDRESALLAKRLRDLRARLSEAYAQRDESLESRQRTDDTELAALERQVADANRQLQLRVRGAAASEPFDLNQLRTVLPGATRLLEFFILGSEVLCFVIDQESVVVKRGLCSVQDVERLVERLRFQLGKGIFGASYLEANSALLRRGLDRLFGELWHCLIAPLGSDGRDAERLVIVPHGPLHGLPLHAAFDGERYLIDHQPVSYAPSARAYTRCAARRAGKLDRPLFVAPRDDRLPWVAHEVTALTTLFPNGELLVDRRASLAGLRRRAGTFDCLHLAAHGRFRADNPSFSTFRLADGWLSVADIAELSRDTSLVTLSACESGLNALAAGDELVGLTRAVLGGGAASLLASLWTVHDEATSRLMAEFYRRLRLDQDRASSLQGAVATIRRDFDSPFFWAPFVLAGA